MPNRYDWWGYAKGMVRRYPKLCAMEADLRQTSTTAAASGMPHGSGVTNPVAAAVERDLPPVNKRELDAVRAAIAEAEQKPNPAERVELIRLMYWKKSHTLAGAALAVHVSERTARRWHTDFIKTVGKNFGLL